MEIACVFFHSVVVGFQTMLNLACLKMSIFAVASLSFAFFWVTVNARDLYQCWPVIRVIFPVMSSII
jgi:hypothetical protein